MIYFALVYPKNGTIGLESIQRWWGNTVAFTTADWRGTSLLPVAEGETFGYVILHMRRR